jgi:hypothetical protein
VVLCVAATLLAVVWRTLPMTAPPLYDGLCLADPYRLLGSSPGPTSASRAFAAGPFQAAEVLTSESPAQAQLLMPGGAFTSSLPLTVRLSPVARPATPLPNDRTFDSNVYSMSATTSTAATTAPYLPLTILLRATASTGPTRVIERLDGQTWTPLQTVNAGCGNTFEAATSRLGEFAVVKIGTAPIGGGGAPVSLIIGAVVGLVTVALVTVTILLPRRSRPTRRAR